MGCYRQAILVLRRLLDGTRVIQLAVDNQISRSTGYAHLHEGLAMLTPTTPSAPPANAGTPYFKALRNVRLRTWKIGRITAAALVIPHIGHGRTT